MINFNAPNPSLADLGLRNTGRLHVNLSASALIEEAIRRGEGVLSDSGALVVRTGKYTGRSPKDKYIDDNDDVHDEIDWGTVNQAFKPYNFDHLLGRVEAYLQGRDLFVFDGYAGADIDHRLSIRVVTEMAWHSLFAHQLFIRPTDKQLETHKPQFTIINAANFQADPLRDGTKTETFIIIDFERKLAIIGGTEYAGEIKKSVFTILNYLLPHQGVMPMHCSANVGTDGRVALFFGLSGTGKTTLSADPDRALIGDDEHGWSENGIFNFEGGCYAKCIKLSPEKEPQISAAIRYGAVLENVVIDPLSRTADYDDATYTENTRVAYPIEYIPGAVIPSVGGHPDTIIFLTADAFGVLPPIAKLTKEQAMYHFLSGYTSKLAGTERGITEPQATFSACFGAPFMPLSPLRYAELLGEKLEKHGTACYLVNTGWTGGAYGVGKRMDLKLTRRMVHAALSGELAKVPYEWDPIFRFLVPTRCPGVPDDVLQPRLTWPDKDAYDRQANVLAKLFVENFVKYAGREHVLESAGPFAGVLIDFPEPVLA